jgi:hypothetical protein
MTRRAQVTKRDPLDCRANVDAELRDTREAVRLERERAKARLRPVPEPAPVATDSDLAMYARVRAACCDESFGGDTAEVDEHAARVVLTIVKERGR